MKYYIIGYKYEEDKEYVITQCNSLKKANCIIKELLSDNWTGLDYFKAMEECYFQSCIYDKTYYYKY